MNEGVNEDGKVTTGHLNWILRVEYELSGGKE
jgi:hypothetical protein